MTNEGEFGLDRSIDLSQLSEGERHVLRLLAKGHTAKSIARALGSTPTAINERLRQARRKSGIGSSREVARILTAQENRDDKIELAANLQVVSHGRRTSAGRFGPVWLGSLVMIIAVIAALGVATHIADQPRPQPALNDKAIQDPIVGSIPPSGKFGIDQLYLRLRAEKRDTSWAPTTEQALRGYLSHIRYVGQPGDPFRVTCGTTLCEAAGVIEAPVTKRDQSGLQSPLNRTMHALQGKDIHDYTASLGLDYTGGEFQSPNSHTTTTFLLYFQRKH